MTLHWPLVLIALLVPLWMLLRSLRPRLKGTAEKSDRILRGVAEADRLVLSRDSSLAQPNGRMPRLWLGVAFAILALARPQWGSLEEPVYTQSREILVAIDLSRSMMATDVSPSRLERAKLLTRDLLEHLKGERVGLVVFSGTAFLQCPLSTDYEIFREFLPALNPKFLPEGGTNYQGMLEASLGAFSQDGGADRFLIVLSDGEANDNSWENLVGDLKKRQVHVIGLGVGTPGGAMIPDPEEGFVKDEQGAVVMSRLESATLQKLASLTNGSYVNASAWIDLHQVLNNTIEQGKLGDFREANRVRLAERYQWPLAVALFLWLWSFMTEFPARPRARRLTKIQNAATTAAGALALLVLLQPRVFAVTPSAGQNPAGSAAAPLSALVRELASAPNQGSRDWLRMAQATVDYARRTRGAGQPVSENSIRDGLAAVDAGETLDPKNAAWALLRKELESYLEKPTPTPTPPEQDKNQKDQEKKQNEQKNPQSKQDESQKNQQDSKEKDSKESGKEQPSSPSPSPRPTPSGAKSSDEKDDQKGLGDMTTPSPAPKPSPQPPKETQKVGGNSDRKKSQEAQKDAALAQPLQKLDEVRNSDSPAELFELMKPTAEPPAKPKGKTW